MPTRSRRSRPFFAGLGVSSSREGVVVDSVLRSSRAEIAGLRAGDVVVAINSRTVSSSLDLADGLRAAAQIEIRRAGRRRTVRIRSIRLAGIQVRAFFRLLRPGAVANRKCDDNCNCTIVVKNAICETWYLPKGKGPHGGIKLEKHCTYSVITPDGPEGDTKNCGTKEYF